MDIGVEAKRWELPFEDAAEHVSELPPPDMFTPGQLVFIRRRAVDTLATLPGVILRKGALSHYELIVSSPERSLFHEQRPAWSMWSDHWPQTYLYLCEELSDRLCAVVATSVGQVAARYNIEAVLERVTATTLH